MNHKINVTKVLTISIHHRFLFIYLFVFQREQPYLGVLRDSWLDIPGLPLAAFRKPYEGLGNQTQLSYMQGKHPSCYPISKVPLRAQSKVSLVKNTLIINIE